MTFRKGESGNPQGRPKGLPDRRTKLRGLLEPHAQELVAKAVELAKAGDTTALRLCLECLIPPIKAKDEHVAVAGLTGTLSQQGDAVLASMRKGRVTPDEAATVLQALAAQARITEFDDLEGRIRQLEEKVDER